MDAVTSTRKRSKNDQECVQYVFKTWNVQLNGNGALLNDQLKMGSGWVVEQFQHCHCP